MLFVADKYAALADLDNVFGGGAAVSWDGQHAGGGGGGEFQARPGVGKSINYRPPGQW